MSQICTSIKTRTKMRLEWDNEGQSLSVDVWMKVMFADKSATFVWRCSNVVTCQVKDQQRRHLLLVNEQVYTETLGTFLIPPIESGFDDDEVTIMKIFTEQRLLKLSSRRDSVIQWCGQKKMYGWNLKQSFRTRLHSARLFDFFYGSFLFAPSALRIISFFTVYLVLESNMPLF